MKFILTLTALTLAVTTVKAADQSAALATYEQQIGYQRRVVLEEQKALDQAFEARDSEVHISRDLLNVIAYGVSSGYLTYDFLRATNNMESVRNYLASKRLPFSSKEVSPVAESVAAEEAAVASTPEKAAVARQIGAVAFRTTEIASAAVLGIFFVGNVIDTGKDLVVRFKDTDDIRDHRQKLVEARKNLSTADQNLQVAVLSESASVQ